MSNKEKLRALLAEARAYVKSVAPCSEPFPCGHYRCTLLNDVDAALAEPVGDTKPKKQTQPWEVFCRHLSVSGLPECDEPQGHKGAHVWRHIETDKLFDRAATMLREAHSERDEARAEVERLSAALWAVRRAWSGRDASCDWGLHSAIEGDAADALHGGNAAATRVEAEITKAHRRGAEAMREAAAQNCAGEVCARQIRALPVPEDK